MLCFGLVTLASSKPRDDISYFLPVGVITTADVSQATPGVQNAAKPGEAKPLADKAGESKPAKEDAPKVSNKPEITTDASPPKPVPKPDPKPADKPEKKPHDFKPDQIADLLKKDDTKKPPKPQDKPPPETPAQDTAKFDANQVAALLDKRTPQRQVATAETVNNAPALGASSGEAAQLTQSEIDAFRKRVSDCWNPPAGVNVSSNIYVDLRIFLKADGSLAQEPTIVAGSASALGPSLAASAKRALLLCQPFTMFKAEHYDQWKDIQVRFNPHEMLGG